MRRLFSVTMSHREDEDLQYDNKHTGKLNKNNFLVPQNLLHLGYSRLFFLSLSLIHCRFDRECALATMYACDLQINVKCNFLDIQISLSQSSVATKLNLSGFVKSFLSRLQLVYFSVDQLLPFVMLCNFFLKNFQFHPQKWT